jgi:hypothetical protein
LLCAVLRSQIVERGVRRRRVLQVHAAAVGRDMMLRELLDAANIR